MLFLTRLKLSKTNCLKLRPSMQQDSLILSLAKSAEFWHFIIILLCHGKSHRRSWFLAQDGRLRKIMVTFLCFYFTVRSTKNVKNTLFLHILSTKSIILASFMATGVSASSYETWLLIGCSDASSQPDFLFHNKDTFRLFSTSFGCLRQSMTTRSRNWKLLQKNENCLKWIYWNYLSNFVR